MRPPPRAPAKKDARFLGVDDAPFAKGDASTVLVGVVTRGPGYVEGVLTTRVGVDGDDATEQLLAALRRSRFRTLLRAVLLNGAFVGGFNLLDPGRIHAELRVPVLALVRSQPRAARVEAAVRKALDNPSPLLARLEDLVAVPIPGARLWGTLRGLDARDAAQIVRATRVRGNLPEPIRLAHVIAGGVARGESKGRA